MLLVQILYLKDTLKAPYHNKQLTVGWEKKIKKQDTLRNKCMYCGKFQAVTVNTFQSTKIHVVKKSQETGSFSYHIWYTA